DKSPSSDTTHSGEVTSTTTNMDVLDSGEYVAAQSLPHTKVQHHDDQRNAHVESSSDNGDDSHEESSSDSGNDSDDEGDNLAEYHSREVMESTDATKSVLVCNPNGIHLEADQSRWFNSKNESSE
ncbi:hypothetical protein HAX54_028559, partial [Datura stramonium]|nr:hypothetical protein [Datura stramonium]